jgi:hypothetical protein
VDVTSSVLWCHESYTHIYNGGEFCGNEFEKFCKKCGIARKKATPYTPQ